MTENETSRTTLHKYNSDLRQNEIFGLQHFTYNNSAMLNLMFESLTNTDFIGLTVSYVHS